MYEKEVLEIYKKCQVERFPIDCGEILHYFNYKTVTYSQAADGDEAKIHLLEKKSSDSFTSRSRRTVFYNDRRDRRRIRFTLMHELGHIYLETDDEDSADIFASEILAPAAIAYYRRFWYAEMITGFFDISTAAANHVVIKARIKPTGDAERLLAYYLDNTRRQTAERLARKPYELPPAPELTWHPALPDPQPDPKPQPKPYWNTPWDVQLASLERQRLGFDYP